MCEVLGHWCVPMTIYTPNNDFKVPQFFPNCIYIINIISRMMLIFHTGLDIS